MTSLQQDLRFALRMMMKTPGVTAVALLALALGIGANTAIYSAISGILLRPPPFPSSQQLVLVFGTQPFVPNSPVSTPDFLDWRKQNQSFSDIAALTYTDFNLGGEGDPERVLGFRVSPNFLRLLQVTPILGRSFTAEEEQAGRGQVAVISAGLWERRYGRDPSVIGRSIVLNGRNVTVVGIVPQGFAIQPFPGTSADLWTPLTIDSKDIGDRGSHWLFVIGRLKPNVTIEQANVEMKTIAGRIGTEFPDTNANFGVKVVSLRDRFAAFSRPALVLLLGASMFVLLIACANVANLLLARAAARQNEIAIRLSLGATRARLVRQLLTESILLAFFGGALGILFALWGIDLLAAGLKGGLLAFMHIELDRRVLVFSAVLTLSTGIIFGLVPALQASKPDLNGQIKEGPSRGTAGPRRTKMRSFFVVSEIALSLTLLVGAGLMMRSLVRLQDVHLGFDPTQVLTMRITLPEAKYDSDERIRSFEEQLLGRIKAIPGVSWAGLTNDLPVSWENVNGPFKIQGKPEWPKGQAPLTEWLVASPEYFKAMGIQVIAGRTFTATDRKGSLPVAVINRTMAARYWPGESPIGQRIHIGWNDDWLEVIGIVDDTKRGGFVGTESVSETYVSYLQIPSERFSLAVRTGMDAAATVATIKQEVQGLDRALPVYDVKTMRAVVDDSLADHRFQATLFSIFAGMALLLSSVGIYGTISHGVGQRTHEIGIRVALGADQVRVRNLFMWQGLQLSCAGIAIGLVASFAVSRVMASLLYGVTPTDFVTFCVVPAILMVSALLATYLPARRAVRIEPMVALRCE
jgi:putative ABC transport system permease protein